MQKQLLRLSRIGLLALVAAYTSSKVTVRRQVYGPKLPNWPLLLEIITEVIQVQIGTHLKGSFSIQGLSSKINAPSKPVKGTTIHPLKIEGLFCEWVIHESAVDSNRVVLYLHGGAYCFMSLQTHRSLTSAISKKSRARVLAVDYRLAPEHPFPAALEDSTLIYRWLISQEGGKVLPSDIVIAGDSAGGGLTVATLLNLRDSGIPLPAAAVCISPWLDLACSSPSWSENYDTDYLPKDGGADFGLMYAKDPANLKNPLASPFYGNLEGLPPILLQVGEAEALRDEGILFAEKARSSGVEVYLEVYENMIHVFQFFSFLPIAAEALTNIGEFIKGKVPKKHSPKLYVVAKSNL